MCATSPHLPFLPTFERCPSLPLVGKQVEFVPSVHGFYVDTQDDIGGTVSRCYLTVLSQASIPAGSQWAGSPLCDGHSELSAQLAETIALLEVRPVYLNLANEPCALLRFEIVSLFGCVCAIADCLIVQQVVEGGRPHDRL